MGETVQWSAGTSYVAGDRVVFQGTPWVAVGSSTGVFPDSDASKWEYDDVSDPIPPAPPAPTGGSGLPQAEATNTVATGENPQTHAVAKIVQVATEDDLAEAFIVTGDAFPRMLWWANQGYGMYLGDGIIDIYNLGASVGFAADGDGGVHVYRIFPPAGGYVEVAGKFKVGAVVATDDATYAADQGPVVRSANGHRWRLAVSDAGVVSATDLGV